MTVLFTVTGATSRDPRIDRWVESQPEPLAGLARTWVARLREAGPAVTEVMHDGCPTLCVGQAPFGYVNAFTAHVNVGFYRGAFLPDPGKLLQGTGRAMRHVKLIPGAALESGRLEDLVAAAYRDIVGRLDVAGWEPSMRPAKQKRGWSGQPHR